jgi:serine/threonine-protein kinase HipA
MTLNGKRDDFVLDDFKACAKAAFMKRGSAETILKQIQDRVAHWRDYAEESGVDPFQRDQIQRTLRITEFG